MSSISSSDEELASQVVEELLVPEESQQPVTDDSLVRQIPASFACSQTTRRNENRRKLRFSVSFPSHSARASNPHSCNTVPAMSGDKAPTPQSHDLLQIIDGRDDDSGCQLRRTASSDQLKRATPRRPIICSICLKEFASGQSLGGHMNVHKKARMLSPRSSSRTAAEQARTGQSSQIETTILQTEEGSASGQNEASPRYVGSSAGDQFSLYKGVRYRSEQDKWIAEIRPPRSKETWWLGTYSTAEEAAHAYDVALCYFGSETSLNFEIHPLHRQVPRIPEDLSRRAFATRLREVVREVARQIMADRGTQTSNASEDGEFNNLPSASNFPEETTADTVVSVPPNPIDGPLEFEGEIKEPMSEDTTMEDIFEQFSPPDDPLFELP